MHRVLCAALAAATFVLPTASALAAPAVETALRPKPRTAMAELEFTAARASAQGFVAWVRAFAPKAQAAGVSAATINAAFAGVSYDPEVIRLDRNQAEFSKPIWEYLASAVSARRVENGREALARHRGTLAAIERKYGVPAEVVVAVWGLETSYGSFTGSSDVIRSLATLAYDGRRASFFEAQLIAALQILEAGDITPRAMRGSWAGAMGHTQFMPTSFLDHAVDFTGDGRRDIWGEDPSDALASTAAYLARFGWQTGQPWGVEVRLPEGFDYARTGRGTAERPGTWAALGVRDMAGRAVPDHGPASILLPAGARGPAFMVFDNFGVIERYNPADAYVIGVGHLADRIGGGAPIQGAWPLGDRALSFSERQELQERLTEAGFDTQGVDGRIGPNTQAAIRRFQSAAGLLPDGYASLALLQRLR